MLLPALLQLIYSKYYVLGVLLAIFVAIFLVPSFLHLDADSATFGEGPFHESARRSEITKFEPIKRRRGPMTVRGIMVHWAESKNSELSALTWRLTLSGGDEQLSNTIGKLEKWRESGNLPKL